MATNIAILRELEELESKLICNKCKNRCTDPVRIRTCGHYFCKNCVNRDLSELCPYCKANYESNDLCFANILREAEPLLKRMKDILTSCDKDLIQDESLVDDGKATSEGCNEIVEKKNCSEFEQKFEICYVENLCKKVNARGESPLHLACKRRKLEDVRNLLRKNIDINMQDFAGWTPLHEAVVVESSEIVEMLIKYGALVNVPGGEYSSPLHKAAASDNEALIKLLLSHGGDKEAIDYFGRKPSECCTKKNTRDLFDENIQPNLLIITPKVFIDNKIVAFCYYVEPAYKEKLKNAKVKIVDKYDAKTVTHFIIRRTHKPSLNIMLAMMEGSTILPQDWIDEYLKKGSIFLPIENYTYILNSELNIGIRKAMLNKLLKLPKLFDGISFFICNFKHPIVINAMKVKRDALINLIRAGGGKILHRAPTPSTSENIKNYPYHANLSGNNLRCCNYIIFDPGNPPSLQYQMAEIKHRSVEWIIDCIINFTLFE